MSILQGAQVLVTGGAGTIGSTVVDHLLQVRGRSSINLLTGLGNEDLPILRSLAGEGLQGSRCRSIDCGAS